LTSGYSGSRTDHPRHPPGTEAAAVSGLGGGRGFDPAGQVIV
jgi:hypothetical protein